MEITPTAAPFAYLIQDVVALTPFSADTIRRAIRQTEPDAFPPPLRAKKDSKGRLIILPKDLAEWLEALPDA